MAGKEEFKQSTSPCPSSTATSSSSPCVTAKTDDPNQKSWRKEVDENLKRLHSLLFGADLALEKQDFESAYILGLRLIGFLDSHCHSDVDQAYIRPIRREAMAKIDTARRSLIPDSDRYLFLCLRLSSSFQFAYIELMTFYFSYSLITTRNWPIGAFYSLQRF